MPDVSVLEVLLYLLPSVVDVAHCVLFRLIKGFVAFVLGATMELVAVREKLPPLTAIPNQKHGKCAHDCSNDKIPVHLSF